MKIRKRKTFRTPTAAEISAHMRSLAKARWKHYAARVAWGEITAENYVYKPRGPMPHDSKAEQDFQSFLEPSAVYWEVRPRATRSGWFRATLQEHGSRLFRHRGKSQSSGLFLGEKGPILLL